VSNPSTETRKEKRDSGFRYLSKKVLDRSKLNRKSTKDRGFQYASITKALAYPSALSSEISP
jgi:hypothetical protein